jgi:hypothetical protein
MKIALIKRDELDTLKYDSCVHYANNGNVFGYSWYLDNTCEFWDVLVEGDYESVMPLPYVNAMGNRLGQNPPWVRQIGPYSVNILSRARIEAFINQIPAAYQVVNYAMSENPGSENIGDFELSIHSQYLLPVMVSYEVLAAGYSPHHKTKVDTTYGGTMRLVNSLKPERIADFLKERVESSIDFKDDLYYFSLLRLMYQMLHKGIGFPTGVIDKDQQLLAVGFFVTSHGKIHLLSGGASEEGIRKNAMYFLLDMLLRTHAGRPSQLSFILPEMDSEKHFFEGFGAKPRNFMSIRRNNLNWVQNSALKMFSPIKNLYE